MEYICNMPGVLGKCPQWQSIFPHEHGGEIGQAFLLVTGGYPLLETFEEELGSMEHQWIRISCNIKKDTAITLNTQQTFNRNCLG